MISLTLEPEEKISIRWNGHHGCSSYTFTGDRLYTESLAMGRAPLDLRVRELERANKEFQVDIDSAHKHLNDWKYEFWEKEREILVVRDELKKKEKELEDALKSKTISVHNYYQASTKWEPIKTAPKDGTPILLIDVDKTIIQCAWIESFSHWMMAGGSDGKQIVYGAAKPTHWMPLPQPPKI